MACECNVVTSGMMLCCAERRSRFGEGDPWASGMWSVIKLMACVWGVCGSCTTEFGAGWGRDCEVVGIGRFEAMVKVLGVQLKGMYVGGN